MAGVKISALPALTTPAATDIYPTVQTGVTYKVTLEQISEFIAGNPVVRLATTGALTVTYNNGTAGVGATLTNAGALAALTIDGTAVVVGDRILVKDQASTLQNGVYTVTVVGNGATAWVLTRALDYDQPSEIDPGDMFTVGAGTVNIGTIWVETAVVTTVGTDPITFISYSITATPTSGRVLRGNGTNWVTSTFSIADTYAINSIVYASAANTLTALAPSLSSVLASSAASTGVPTWIGPLTNGQLVIGSTGATPVAAVLTGSSGITITNGAGSINISGGGSGYSWTEVTGVTQAMAVDSGYIANNAGLVTLTLPAIAVVGDTVIVQGKGAGGFLIAQNAGQVINYGSSPTTVGVGGSLASTNQWDSVELLCVTANTTWAVLTGTQGVLTVV